MTSQYKEHLFSEAHYETPKQHGIERYGDAWAECIGELDVTIPVLQTEYPGLRISRSDLQGYHFLQYGADADIVDESINAITANKTDWLYDGTLPGRAKELLEGDQSLTTPIQLGRIAVPRHVEAIAGTGALAAYGEHKKVTGYGGERRVGSFWYPYPNANAYFLGRKSTDIIASLQMIHDAMFEQVERRSFPIKLESNFRTDLPYRLPIESLAINTDSVLFVNDEGNDQAIEIQSVSHSGKTEITAIHEV